MTGPQTVVLSGTVGAGKSTVATALVDELLARGYRATSIEVDELAHRGPPSPIDDPFNERAVVRELESVVPNLRELGIEVLVLPRVVETQSQRQAYADALAGPLRVVRLDASADTRRRRLVERHDAGPDRDWHLARTDVLADALLTCGAEDLSVTNEGRPASVVAAQIAEALGLLAPG
jgi:predicted kinase